MKKIIYLGMENTPHTVYETAHVQNSRVIYQYENDAGKRVELEATQDSTAYAPPHNHKQYPLNDAPICRAGHRYPIDILSKGYSGHYFRIVEA